MDPAWVLFVYSLCAAIQRAEFSSHPFRRIHLCGLRMWLIYLSRGMELQARIAPTVNWFPFAIPGDPFCSNLKNSFEQISSVTWPLGGLHLCMALCFAWKLRVPRRGLVRWCSRLQPGLAQSHLYKGIRNNCVFSGGEWRRMSSLHPTSTPKLPLV